MIRAAKDVMKIIRGGMNETGERVREYCHTGMLDSYHQWTRTWEKELLTKEEREDGLIRCSWEKSQTEKHMLLSVAFYLLFVLFGSVLVKSTWGTGWMYIYAVLISVLLFMRISSLFKRRFQLSARERWLNNLVIQDVQMITGLENKEEGVTEV